MEEGREGRKGRWHRRRHSLACPLGDDLAAQIGLANYLPRRCGRGGGRRAAAGGGGSIGMLHSAATPSVASLPSLSLLSIEKYCLNLIMARTHRRWCFGLFVAGVVMGAFVKASFAKCGRFFARIRAPLSGGRVMHLATAAGCSTLIVCFQILGVESLIRHCSTDIKLVYCRTFQNSGTWCE